MAIAYAEDGSKIEVSSLLWELQIMAQTKKPLFAGRLEDDWWKESETLSVGIKKGYIEIVPNKGFIITDKGINLLREQGLHTTRSPLGDFSESLKPKNKK